MSEISRRLILLKFSIITVAVVFAAIGFFNFTAKYEKVSASALGPTASHTNAPGESNCTACHSDYPVNSGTGRVVISGVPANYLPNQQIPVTVTVSQDTAVVYGFQLTAIDNLGREAGTFTLPAQQPQQLQIVDGIAGGFPRKYVEHTVSGIVPTMFGAKSWTFIWNAPAERVGKVGFYAAGNAANSDGDTSGDYIYTNSKNTLTGTATSNFDSDGKSDIAVFRPSNGIWYSLNSSNGDLKAMQFGASTDKLVAGDFDGDGISDYAVWRPSNGTWYVNRSTDGFTSMQFGGSGDIPLVGDFDGDLKTDYAVFRPSNGVWYIQKSTGNFSAIQFGSATDKPVPGDFDGDGKTDLAVYRDGTWFILKSRDGFTSMQFGAATDKPIPADYDGDGKTDIAVFRPSNGIWYFQKSRDGFSAVQFGISTDKPVPADYDGDGKTDIAVFRNGSWFIINSADDSFNQILFGASDDVPVAGSQIP